MSGDFESKYFPQPLYPELYDLRVDRSEVILMVGKYDKKSEMKINTEISRELELSHLKVIGAMIDLLKSNRTRAYTQSLIEDVLESKYSQELGIKSFSKSNLQKIFSKANKALKDK